MRDQMNIAFHINSCGLAARSFPLINLPSHALKKSNHCPVLSPDLVATDENLQAIKMIYLDILLIGEQNEVLISSSNRNLLCTQSQCTAHAVRKGCIRTMLKDVAYIVPDTIYSKEGFVLKNWMEGLSDEVYYLPQGVTFFWLKQVNCTIATEQKKVLFHR